MLFVVVVVVAVVVVVVSVVVVVGVVIVSGVVVVSTGNNKISHSSHLSQMPIANGTQDKQKHKREHDEQSTTCIKE